MIWLLDSDGSAFSGVETVKNIVPRNDTIKVINRLLDGAFHTQTIGTPAKTVSFSVICNFTAKSSIDAAEGNGAPVTVIGDGETYTGIIRDSIDWRHIPKDYYEASITILVTETGAA